MPSSTRPDPSVEPIVERSRPPRPRAGEDSAERSFRVVPATADRWDDVVRVLGGDGDLGCWCQAPRGRVPGGRTTQPGLRRAALRDQLAEEPPPGMLAYDGDEVVGWCGFGPRPLLPRLVRSRTIPAIDDRPVWAILCFKIRVGHRRRGAARALLAGVIEYARRSGAPGVEAYPIDPEGGRVDVGFAFVGLTPMFEQAGFRRVVETDARSAGRPRVLMRLDFDR